MSSTLGREKGNPEKPIYTNDKDSNFYKESEENKIFNLKKGFFNRKYSIFLKYSNFKR